MVIDHGAVPIFVQLLSSPGDDVREQVISWITLQINFKHVATLYMDRVYLDTICGNLILVILDAI